MPSVICYKCGRVIISSSGLGIEYGICDKCLEEYMKAVKKMVENCRGPGKPGDDE